MQRDTLSMDKLNSTFLTNLIFRVNEIKLTLKSPNSIFKEPVKLILKYGRKTKGPRMAKTLLK